ncbi:MAG: helix-turn-helix domain-containing protein [Thiomicrospira sp.]|jgi:AraC-like DNA-binding protein|nr:helix-turn-helix domain-containing protein [Thiomicrospira sp.]
MMYIEHAPPADLAQILDCFWHARVGQETQHILPDGCQDWIFRYDSSMSASVIGSMSQAQKLQCVEPSLFFGIRFQPGALSLFSTMPMSHITDQSIALYDAFAVSSATQQALAVDNLAIHEFASIMSQALRQKLAAVDRDRLALIQQLRRTREGQIQHMAHSLHISRRQLQRLFQNHFGYSPRFYAKVMRFTQLISHLDPAKPLVQTALDLGYYDQAHMGREIKQLSGLTPSQLIQHAVPNVQSTTY